MLEPERENHTNGTGCDLQGRSVNHYQQASRAGSKIPPLYKLLTQNPTSNLKAIGTNKRIYSGHVSPPAWVLKSLLNFDYFQQHHLEVGVLASSFDKSNSQAELKILWRGLNTSVAYKGRSMSNADSWPCLSLRSGPRLENPEDAAWFRVCTRQLRVQRFRGWKFRSRPAPSSWYKAYGDT